MAKARRWSPAASRRACRCRSWPASSWTATEGQLALAATDMELSLRTTLEAQIEGEGSTVVQGKLLVDLARLLPESQVTIEHRPDEGVLRVEVRLVQLPAQHLQHVDDFPRLPEIDEASLHSVERTALLETVARVSRSASRDESRPVLTGILVRFEAGKLVMAATDSYRLSVKETPIEGDPLELEAIVPAKALAELGRIVQSGDSIRIGVRENQVIFGAEGAWLTTRRIDGQFPNYRQLLPESFEHEVTLPREELLDVVRRTAVLAQRNSPLRLRFGDGELAVSAQTQDVGEAREVLPAAFTADPLEIGFNADFLRDGIESISSDELQLKLISPLRPAVIQAPGDDFTYLIMPIRLAG